LAVNDELFSQERLNATGKLQARPLQKTVAASCVIADTEAAHRADEYMCLSRTVISKLTNLLLGFIVNRWRSNYLRQPNQDKLNTIMERIKDHRMPGCMGSLDCCHWDWQQCPTGMAAAYQICKGKTCIVVETVCDKDLWMWHLFVGAPGSLNDMNVMQKSNLYLDVTGGHSPPRSMPVTINERTRTLPCYLFDGIYPRYAFLLSPPSNTSTKEHTTFKRLQEAIQNDMERVFGALRKRFHVVLHPGGNHTVSQLVTT